MVWLCCHTGPGHLRDETVNALMMWASHDDIGFVYVGGTHLDYGLALLDAWNCGDDLAIVEPDIVIRPDVFNGFHHCDHDYCCYPYALTTDVMPALGCTRFTKAFMGAYPDAMSEALEKPCGYGAGHFRSVDVGLMRYVLVREHGVQPHVHLPAVQHLNEEKALVPEASTEPVMEVPSW